MLADMPIEEKFLSIYPLKISHFGILCKSHKKKKKKNCSGLNWDMQGLNTTKLQLLKYLKPLSACSK